MKPKGTFLSPAKLNLYLNILGKHPDGYHAIESVVERISLCDRLTVSLEPGKEIRLVSSVKSLENENNLCFKAARLIKDVYHLPFGVALRLDKKIPIGAGLGGGSSNAATVLLAINHLAGLRLSRPRLYQLGARLGSDVNFFLSGSRYAVIGGRGEKIAPFKGKAFRHLVVSPGVSLSTALVYQSFAAKLTKNLDNVNMIKYAIKTGDESLLAQNIFNALEKSAETLCPAISRAKERFARAGIDLRVTGSGSALYSVGQAAAVPKDKRCQVFEAVSW